MSDLLNIKQGVTESLFGIFYSDEIIVKDRLYGFFSDLREELGEWVHVRQDYQSPRIFYGYIENISQVK